MPALARATTGSGIVTGGEHAHGPAAYDRAFAVGVVLNLAFVAGP